jgi:hypothetical protein
VRPGIDFNLTYFRIQLQTDWLQLRHLNDHIHDVRWGVFPSLLELQNLVSSQITLPRVMRTDTKAAGNAIVQLDMKVS